MSTVEQVERELARLEGLETVTDDDLERFRRTLPTDPERATVVKRGLPFPWGDIFEYVSPSARQSGYWRVAYDRSEPRSSAEAAVQARFADAARASEGVRGTVERDGAEVPLSAAVAGDAVSGLRVSTARARASGQKALRRLREVLGV